MARQDWSKYLAQPEAPQQPSNDWSKYLVPDATPAPKKGFIDLVPDILQDPLRPFVDPFQKAWDWASHTELLGKYPGKLASMAMTPKVLADPLLPNWAKEYYMTQYEPVMRDIANQTFTPTNVALTAATGGEYAAARAGAKGLTLGLNALQRLASIPMVAEGWQQIGEQDTLLGKGFGALEMIGGIVGMKAGPPQIARGKPPTPEAPIPKPKITVEDFVRLRNEGKLATKPRTLDPNLNQGIGDAELAGSVPYTPTTGMINPATGRPMQPATNAPGPLRGPDTPWPDPFADMGHTEFMDIMRKPPAEFERAEDVLTPLVRKPTSLVPEAAPGNPLGIPEEPSFSRIRRNPSSVIESFRSGLPIAKAASRKDTRFILPDGTRLTHNTDIHEDAARSLGYSLDDALNSGIIRIGVGFDGAEIQAPITMRQAEELADAVHYTGKIMHVDVYPPTKNVQYKIFTEDASAANIYDWVNAQFRRGPEEPQFSRILGFDRDFRRNQFADELSNLEEQIVMADTAGDTKKSVLLKDLYQRKYDAYSRFLKNDLPQEPQFARTKEGVKIGADIGSLSKVLGSSLYQGDIAHIATKELLQNSLDAVDALGPSGKVAVKFSRGVKAGDYDYSTSSRAATDIPAFVEVSDNGPGLTKAELETVFTDLGASGKRDIESAKGGFGLAKAAPLLGGKRVKVTTVALEELRPGTKIKMMHTFEGTPDELIAGVEVTSKPAPSMPTGTTVRTEIPEGSDPWAAQQFSENLAEYSPFIQSEITVDKGYGPEILKPAGAKNLEDFDITPVTTPGADLEIMVPKGTPYGENYVKLQLLNQGMWQRGFIEDYSRYPGIPEKIMVNVKSKVPEGHPDYPFTANRETLRGTALAELQKHIQDVIIRPSVGRRVQQLKDVYNSMTPIEAVTSKGRPSSKISGRKPNMTGRMKMVQGKLTPMAEPPNPEIPFTVYDVGKKFTPAEMQEFVNNPAVIRLSQQISDVLHDTLEITPWNTDPLEKIGLIFYEKAHGIHIPSPGTNKSAILINPFDVMMTEKPENAAAGIAHTIYHELSHIGGVGHTEDFTSRLGDLYTNLGARKDLEFQERFFDAITDPRDRTSYSPEISEILQRYKAIRGRESTIEDPLIGTGISSRIKRPGGTGKTPGSGGPSGEAVTKLVAAIKEAKPIRAEQEMMYSAEKSERVKQMMKTKIVSEASAKKALGALAGEYEKVDFTPIKLDQKDVDSLFKAIGDSALSPFQKARAITGMGKIIGEFGANVPQNSELYLLDQVFGPGFSKSLNDAGFIKMSLGKEKINLMHELVNAPRAIMASIDFSAPLRQGIGMITHKAFWTSLDDMFKSWKSQEFYDATMRAIEKSDGYAISQHAGLQITDLTKMSKREEAFTSKIAEMLPGVKRSERAYMAFLNKTRFDTFMSLIKDAERSGFNPLMDDKMLKDIAGYVNNASGRGSLGSFETAAVGLNSVFFSPRLIASRVRMLNPATYVNTSPFVRKQYMRSLIGIAGLGATSLGIAKAFGADIESNPSSADFGKAKIGNVRLDPFGGFQQYIVAAHRLISGEMKSTTSGREFELGKGYGTPTKLDVAFRFGQSKLNPTMSFVTTLLQNKDFNGLPIEVRHEITSRFVPIILQDIYELAKEDPELVNPKLLLTIPAMFGMGVQSYEPRRPSGTNIQYGDIDERQQSETIRY